MGAVDQAWQESVFTDGHCHRPANAGTIGVRDKATGEMFAVAGLAAEADVNAAVAGAAAAQAAWRLGGRSGGDSNLGSSPSGAGWPPRLAPLTVRLLR